MSLLGPFVSNEYVNIKKSTLKIKIKLTKKLKLSAP